MPEKVLKKYDPFFGVSGEILHDRPRRPARALTGRSM